MKIFVRFLKNGPYLLERTTMMFCENAGCFERSEERGQTAQTGLSSVLSNAVAALPDHIAILDETGQVVAVNEAWRQFGVTNGLRDKRYCLGANYLKVCDAANSGDAAEATFVAAGLRRLLQEKRGVLRLAYPCHSKVERRWFHLEATPFQTAFRTYVVVAHKDISSLKQAAQTKSDREDLLTQQVETLSKELVRKRRELSRATQALRTVAHFIGHNLRAPLRAMHGFSTLLERSSRNLDSADQIYTQRIQASAERMDTLLHGLVGYTRVAAGRFPLESLDPVPLMRRVVERVQPEGNGAAAHITVTEPLPRVWANRDLLELVFSNLLSNALKFTTPGVSPRVDIFCEKRQGWARFIIQDQGTGLSPEMRQQLFGPLHTILTFSESGAGVGLLQVQAAAERMNARLGVESNPARGSRFWIELPQNAPSAP